MNRQELQEALSVSLIVGLGFAAIDYALGMDPYLGVYAGIGSLTYFLGKSIVNGWIEK